MPAKRPKAATVPAAQEAVTLAFRPNPPTGGVPPPPVSPAPVPKVATLDTEAIRRHISAMMASKPAPPYVATESEPLKATYAERTHVEGLKPLPTLKSLSTLKELPPLKPVA
jgi:hypothetical protein